MAYHVDRTTSINLGKTTILVGDLRELLAEFSDDTIMGIEYHAGYDQRDRDYATLVFKIPAPSKPKAGS